MSVIENRFQGKWDIVVTGSSLTLHLWDMDDPEGPTIPMTVSPGPYEGHEYLSGIDNSKWILIKVPARNEWRGMPLSRWLDRERSDVRVRLFEYVNPVPQGG